MDKLGNGAGKGKARSPWHVLPGVMESRVCVLQGGVEFNPQKSPVKGSMVDGEAAITSTRVTWLNSAGPMAKVWDTRSPVPLAVALLGCALWAGTSLLRVGNGPSK